MENRASSSSTAMEFYSDTFWTFCEIKSYNYLKISKSRRGYAPRQNTSACQGKEDGSTSALYVVVSDQSWVYSGVALISFQIYSRSGVDPHCSTPWSRTYAARLIPFHWSRGVSFYSGLLQCLNFSHQNISDVFNSSFKWLFKKQNILSPPEVIKEVAWIFKLQSRPELNEPPLLQ